MPVKKYTVKIKPRAVRELKCLPENVQRRVIAALEKLENGLSGDVKRLTNYTPEYRVRVGEYRVLFEVEKDSVVVYRISLRRDAYRRQG
ncbi:MAG TPA: type II toxin-antitoxin system RelE/ParE family toxin [Candidatus Hydrogenedentes bacterium]|nr:type II toxin-antitoxin system RelE/ParE family toxin [Candidatus Hydrogenedentota bacterium]